MNIKYGPKTSIRGVVQEKPEGFYWVVEVSIEGHDEEFLSVDSSEGPDPIYFKTKDLALAALDVAGKDVAKEIEATLKEKLGFDTVDVIDRKREN